jgi:hypothetical protein
MIRNQNIYILSVTAGLFAATPAFGMFSAWKQEKKAKAELQTLQRKAQQAYLMEIFNMEEAPSITLQEELNDIKSFLLCLPDSPEPKLSKAKL